MWIIIWKNVYDSWSPWPGPRGCFGALSAPQEHRAHSTILYQFVISQGAHARTRAANRIGREQTSADSGAS